MQNSSRRNLILLLTIFVGLHSKEQYQKSYVKNSDWPCYGKDPGGSRYSALRQINIANVKNLKVAWTFQTDELKKYGGTSAASKAAFEATPIMIDNTLYFSTPSDRVFAIDAITGKQKWEYDPRVNLKKGFSEITSRGVASWPAPGSKKDSGSKRIIFIGTIDGRLIALHAETGKPVTPFGKEGTVDLSKGVTDEMQGSGKDISMTSPPSVINDLIIVGSSMGDNYRFDYPQGVVRAYEVKTGKLRWSWNPNPRDSTDKAWKTWNGVDAHKSGGANAWSIISVDPERNMVFIPTTSPSPDYYGGKRLGQNLYGNSIVALNASTGKMIWHFQVVHHDLWDYDIAAQPMLVTINSKGKKIPAVVIGTKQGHIFVFNRSTGEPLFPIEERPVPASEVEGEEAFPHQPFPVLPAPIGLQSITVKDAWGPTQKDQEEAENKISKYVNKGPFTPPGYAGTIVAPGNVGGINWSGMCYDPQNHMLVTNINRFVAVITIIPREKLSEANKQKEFLRAETGLMLGTPYVMKRDYLFKSDSNGLVVQTKPPWGSLIGIDLNTGEKKWEVPLGYQMDLQKYPEAINWGSLSFGGAISTAGNLSFIAGTFDQHLRAFDTKTGKLVWEYLLPAAAQATPMTYLANGKQYIVIAAGGHGKLGSKLGDYVVAFTLPSSK